MIYAHKAVLTVMLLSLGACAVTRPRPQCRPDAQPALDDRLFFGSAGPDGEISNADWSRFVDESVSPRFTQGLTVFNATGQWRDARAGEVQERTHVLELVHPDTAENESSIKAIISIYKTQFRQESVLRVVEAACIAF